MRDRAPKIRVLVVDDSALVREILRSRLSADPRIDVVATAADPFEARTKIEGLDVDVVTLDLEMPRMDGLTFLRHLMRDHPLPVVVVSSLTGSHETALDCLAHGAVDWVAKPGGTRTVEALVEELIEKIVNTTADPRKAKVPAGSLIVVGASTGGTQALEALFRSFPSDFPPVVAVIHMPPGFTRSFAQRLDALVAMTVKEADEGDVLSPGTVYIAPGDRHIEVRAEGPRRVVRLGDGPRVFNQRPAVDVLFRSAADLGGSRIYGLLLTGMGKDGAAGLKAIRDAGGRTVAQDEASCVVFGMPKEAIQIGAAEAVLSLNAMTPWLLSSFSGPH